MAKLGLLSAAMVGKWGDRDAGRRMPCGEYERGVERKAGPGREALARKHLTSWGRTGKQD